MLMRKGGSEFTKKKTKGRLVRNGGKYLANGQLKPEFMKEELARANKIKDDQKRAAAYEQIMSGRRTASTVLVTGEDVTLEDTQMLLTHLRWAMKGRAMRKINKITGGNHTKHVLTEARSLIG